MRRDPFPLETNDESLKLNCRPSARRRTTTDRTGKEYQVFTWRDGSRAQTWSRDAGSDENGRSPKRNVAERATLEYKSAERTPYWQNDERSTRRSSWQTDEWRVCDRCSKPKTYKDSAMTFDGPFSSAYHRGCSLQDMEASWRRGEGDWRWWCTECEH